jgi:acyl-ACP thioesterase
VAVDEAWSVEMVGPREKGRRYLREATVRLGDAGADGRLRPDGFARLLQDVASDDWADTGIVDGATWVLRRTTMRLVGLAWPLLGWRLELRTFCSGIGAAWAERRTDLLVDGELLAEAAAIWVPVDHAGRPQRVSAGFHEAYAEAAGGRRVPGRVPAPDESGPAAERRSWPLRRADVDVVDHVNNAAIWAALTEVIEGPLIWASLIHHGAVLGHDEVTLVVEPGRLGLEVAGGRRVSARWKLSVGDVGAPSR